MTSDETLQALRREIDAMDDKIIALLKERSGIVKKVGVWKECDAPGKCPIRAGREAEQVRRVVQEFKGSAFNPAAAADIWRSIIMASLSIEGEIKISVYAPEADRALFWTAREYFGPFSQYTRQPTPKRVIGDVLDGKAQVGVLPPLDQADLRWWTEIVSTAQEKPQIFACLPFVMTHKPSRDVPSAIAVSRVTPEATGDDVTYVVLDADELASQHRMQAAFSAAGIEPRWLEIYTPTPGKRVHIMELKGFITQDSPAFQQVVAALGTSLNSSVILGAHAAPIQLFAS